MGIGDKQRMERERRERYERAIYSVAPEADAVSDVLALVDAEIEPLQEQIEEQAQRLAMASGLRVQVEALQATIQNAIETMVWLEAEGAEPYEKLRELLMGTVPEPEYEYAHWNIPGGYVDDERFETLEGAALEMTAWMKPQNWKIVRRPKPQEWEDVPTG